MTTIEKFICQSCGLAGEPTLAPDVCASCQSEALERVQAALVAEGLPEETWALTNAGLLTDAGLLVLVGVTCEPEQASRLLTFDGAEALARHRGRLVWRLAMQVTVLEKQLDRMREELDESGYLKPAADPIEALQIALGDAAERCEAREVLDAHESLGAAESLTSGLQEAIEVMSEHEEATAILSEHELMGPYDSLPEAVRDLVDETAEVRELLAAAGHLGWDSTLSEAVAEAIEAVQERCELQTALEREQKRSGELITIACRALAHAQAAAYTGAMEACPTCATDWADIGGFNDATV